MILGDFTEKDFELLAAKLELARQECQAKAIAQSDTNGGGGTHRELPIPERQVAA